MSSCHCDTPQERCFHCGGELPQGCGKSVNLGGKTRRVCSADCQHTAEWIANNGLADFYQLRSVSGGPQASTPPANSIQADDWNSEALQKRLLTVRNDGRYELSLLIDGMHCAGCAWLIERALLKLAGVSDIQINPITHRARLSFDRDQTSLGSILGTLQQAGYQPRPLQASALNDARNQENRDLLKRLLVAGFGMMQVMTYAFVLYMDNINPLPGGTKELFRWLGLLVATPVVFYAALPFFRGARQAIRLRALNMDVPIAIAIAAIYGASALQALSFHGEVYFDSVTMLVFFLLCGRYLEMRARHRSVDSADALIHLTPSVAERRRADGRLEKVAVSDLQTDDRVQVAEGAHVPADGQLLSPKALLDESLLSGESTAQQRLAGDAVIAGSLVLQGPLEIRVTHTGDDTFLSRLNQLSHQAQTERPQLASRQQRASGRFVTRVLLFTAVTLTGWLFYDPSHALEATIALLVVACPCALGLAAPAAITRALGVLAQHHILVVKSDALDTLTRIDHAVFDKTGTLTQPSLDIGDTEATSLQLAASLARESQHPLSRALVSANSLPLLAVDDVQSFPGMGLEGTIQGRKLRLGQAGFVLTDASTELADAALVLGENGQLLASFNLQEQLRDDAASTLEALKKDAIHCELLSGDSRPRVEAISRQLGDIHWQERQQPADKLERLRWHQQQKHCVLAVGDGSNDAPVLAGADVSAALSAGAELAQANADLLICNGHLDGLLYAREIARQTQGILRQNERWAIGYNTLAMPIAALGFIPPWLAAILMSCSSLLVVLNALRIGKARPNKSTQQEAATSCCAATTNSCSQPPQGEQP